MIPVWQSYIGESSGNGSAGWKDGDNAIFVINTVCAALAAAAATCIDDLDGLWAATCIEDLDQRAAVKRTFWAPAMDAIVLLLKNPRMACLMWLNVTFGVCSSYMNSYVTSVPVPYFVGKGMGGYMSAITAAAAATFSLLLLFGAEQSSKRITMVVGPAAFMAMAILPLAAGCGHAWHFGCADPMLVMQVQCAGKLGRHGLGVYIPRDREGGLGRN